MSKLPPYNITFIPSDGKNLTNTDIKNTIKNYDDYYVARYFFIQLETADTYMNYHEIEIYDENGINVALTGVAIQSSTPTWAPETEGDANYAINGRNDTGPLQHTLNNVSTNYEWLGIDLKASRKITGIRIYGRNTGHAYAEGGSGYTRTAPFRIFLYKESEWKSSFENHVTGPGYRDNTDKYFHLHSDDARKETRFFISTSQTIFYYGINALVPLNTTTKEYVNELNLYGNKSIINVTHENLPPYKITFEPSVIRYREARYLFLQLENVTIMSYGEIEIYDENGTNIADNLGTSSYIASSIWNNASSTSSLAAWKVGDGNKLSIHHTASTGTYNEKPWVAIDLGSNKKISSIEIYGRGDNTVFAEGGGGYARTAPFRIFLYTSDEYTGTFSNYGTGPLDYNNYTLHTDDADVNETINDGKQQRFNFDLSQTKIRPTDISYAITNYDTTVGFKEAQYFFIQLETEYKHMHYAEIEIYDENGNNVAFNASQNAIQSSSYGSNIASNAFNNNTTGDFNHTNSASGEREWLGINLGSNKKIAGIRVYGRGDQEQYTEGGGAYARTAPFRIFLYKSDEYTGTFAAGYNNGPLDYDSYHLHSSNASYNSTHTSTGTQQIFYFGIEATLTRKSPSITNHKAIARIVNSPQYNIKVYPLNSTEITVDDIKEANTNYQFAEKSVFFIQAETAGDWRIREWQILDPSGISYMTTDHYSTPKVSSSVISSITATSSHSGGSHPVSKITDGTASSWISGSATNIKNWVGIQFSSDKPIGIFRITGNKRRSFRVYLYTASEWGQRSLSDGPIDYDKYDLHSSDALLTLSDNSNSYDESDTYQYNFGINYIVPKNITTLPDLSNIYNLSSINSSDNTLMTTGNYIGYSYPDGSKVEKFHPYNITIDNGTSLNKTARYVFIILEVTNQLLLMNEVEIYDENGNNIAINKYTTQSSTATWSGYTHNPSKAVDGGRTGITYSATNWDANAAFTNGIQDGNNNWYNWWGVDLGSDKTISGIRIYGHDYSSYLENGSEWSRHAPHRIQVYTTSEYSNSNTSFNNNNGPLAWDTYPYLDFSNNCILSLDNGQQLFDYGSTPIIAADVSNAISNYDATVGFMQARYFFIENESFDIPMNLGEIEIFDPSGNNVVPNNTTNIKVSSSNGNGTTINKSQVYDGEYNFRVYTAERSGLRGWIGIDLGSDKKIAGIRIYGRKGEDGIGSNTFRAFPFRVFLYRDWFYYDRFIDGTQGQSGSLDYGDYSLKSSDFTIVGYEKGTVPTNNDNADSDRYYAYYGIVQNVSSKNVAPLYNNNALVKVKKSNNSLPPYKITVTPCVTKLHEARYFFIQLEDHPGLRMWYAEIEIYDENGINIAASTNNSTNNSYAHSSVPSDGDTYPASNAFDGNITNYHKNDGREQTGYRGWLGVDLGSDKKISGIRIYGRDNNYYTRGNDGYNTTAPFRIYLYKESEYTENFVDNGTGPLDFDDYKLHSDYADANFNQTGNQEIFYFDLEQTKIRTHDISNAIVNYDNTKGFKLARYFYLQLETVETIMNYSEIEIYDETGTNIADDFLNVDTQSSSHVSGSYSASKAFDGNFTGSGYHHTKDDPIPSNTRTWIGVDLGEDKKIAGIRVFGRDTYTYDAGNSFLRGAPFRIFLYSDVEFTDANANFTNGPIDYNTYHLRSSKDHFVNGPSNIDVTGSISDVAQLPYWYFGIELQIGDVKEEVHSVPSNIESYNKAIADIEYVNYLGHGNYYHMDVSMHYSDISYGVYLPTVTFTNSNSDGRFTYDMRRQQLSELGFTGFYEADFADDIEYIENAAFFQDTKVCVATINKVKYIEASAFKNCYNLRAVTLDTASNSGGSPNLLDIGESAFENCISLKQIYIPDDEIYAKVFKGCISLEVAVLGINFRSSDAWDAGDGSSVPHRIIGESAFENCTSLTSFYIPERVKRVEHDAFKNCSSLETLYISRFTSSSAKYHPAINYSHEATTAYKNISNNCIVYVNELEYDSTFGFALTERNHADSQFPNANNIRRYTVVPYSYQTVNGVNKLTYNHINTRCATFLGTGTSDYNKYWVAETYFGSNPTIIDSNAFRYRTNNTAMKYKNLVAISIGNGGSLKYIDDQCFVDLPVFQGLYIPKCITTFYGQGNQQYSMVVVNCSECRQIVFDYDSPDISIEGENNDDHHTFAENDKLRAIIFPHRLTKIVSKMCKDNPKLQLVNIFQKNAKTSLTTFKRYNHFQNSNLQEIHLFVNNTTIYTGNNLFTGCDNLKRIYIYNNHTTTTTELYNNNNITPSVFYVIKDSTANAIRVHTDWNLHIIFKTSVTTITAGIYRNNLRLKTITFEHNTSSTQNSLAMPGNFYGTFQDIGIGDGANHIKWNNRVITFPNQTNATNYGIFEKCNQLTSFYIPDQFSEIPARFLGMGNGGNGTKRGYGKLSKIYWGKNPSVKRIGRHCLEYTKIYKLHIPASVAVTDNLPFYRTYNLMKVTFGAGSRLKRADQRILGANPEGGMEIVPHLSELVLPSSLITLGKEALFNSVGRGYIENLIIPSSVDFLDENIVWGWGDLEYSDLTKTSNPKIGNIFIPNSITKLPGQRRHHGYLSKGTHSDGGIRAVPYCRTYIPLHLAGEAYDKNDTSYFQTDTFLDYYHFVTFDGTNNTVSNISYKTYYHAEIGINVTTIGDGTNPLDNTLYSHRLISVNFPPLVRTINTNAFKNCSKLTYVTFHENSNLRTINANAFENCTNIHDIILPHKLTTIGANAFKGCTNLRTIEIPYDVTSIGNGAFIDCDNLGQVTIIDTLFNDISNNLNNIFETENIKVIPTVEFTDTNLTLAKYISTMYANNLYQGSVYRPKFTNSVETIDLNIYGVFVELNLCEKYLDDKFVTSGLISRNINGVKTPINCGVFLIIDKEYSFTALSRYPIYTNIPAYEVTYRSNDLYVDLTLKNKDDQYFITPGYSVVVYDKHYEDMNMNLLGDDNYATEHYGIMDISNTTTSLYGTPTNQEGGTMQNKSGSVKIFYNNRSVIKKSV